MKERNQYKSETFGTLFTDSKEHHQSLPTIKMSRLLLSLLAILAIFSVTVSSKQVCPENEEWQSCASRCELTCEKPDPRPCTLECVRGCRCVDGLIRNSSGKCVRRAEC
ncbi:chymotrypsin inhibitor-like [Osmia lignaria lignaria]|uniref:chymotrypsin inhibitor-like n=1 Tax=Osmia lignaria lignaria TaxID=1437193 RepID=UPI00402B23A3